MSVLQGDFIGFTLGDTHSSELGIIRTSDGSRFTQNLLPSYSDKTIQVQGGDGTYYFGTNYNRRVIPINFAFDNVTEDKIRKMQHLFGKRELQDLIFDEYPYKVYKVKISGDPFLKTICFDKGESDSILQTKDSLYNPKEGVFNGRIYKGEGSVSFVCYSPFAKSRYKYLEDYNQTIFKNIDEWQESSGIRSKGSYDVYDSTNKRILLYNGGDLETDYLLECIPTNLNSASIVKIKMNDDTDKQLEISIPANGLKSGDSGFRINSKLNLIEGINQRKEVTGTVYNRYITGGNFFKIPLGDSILNFTNIANINSPTILYDFLYY